MLKDGHIHTPYCPHGSQDSFEMYIEKAIKLGFQEITFTEHAPLPEGFIDPTPKQDSAMRLEQLDEYFSTLTNLKHSYKNQICIRSGLEVDYIEGFEEQTTNFLSQYGKQFDEAILSVHFLKYKERYYCLDYSPDSFQQMIDDFGSTESIYEHYYHTLLQSIVTDLGSYKPNRIGHITLVHKFQKKFPVSRSFQSQLHDILKSIKAYDYELDYNSAGLRKPLCRETYPPLWVIEKAKEMNIPLIYGSDAHSAKELGASL